MPGLLEPPVLLTVQDGAIPAAISKKQPIRYTSATASNRPPRRVAAPGKFRRSSLFAEAAVAQLDPNTLQVDIYWEADGAIEDDLYVFVHVSGPQGPGRK